MCGATGKQTSNARPRRLRRGTTPATPNLDSRVADVSCSGIAAARDNRRELLHEPALRERGSVLTGIVVNPREVDRAR